MNSIKSTDGTKTFLGGLWASEHPRSFIGVKDGSVFRNIPITSIDEAISVASEHIDKGADVYMACAQFSTHEGRKAENASAMNAFWLDLDCGADKAAKGVGYESKNAAAKALCEFCVKTGFPVPCIVNINPAN